MERKEDLLEAQRYRRTQCARAMFGVTPAHALHTGPGPWAGPVLGLIVAALLSLVSPVMGLVSQAPSSPVQAPSPSVPVAPAAPPAASAVPQVSEQDVQGQEGSDAPH